MLLVLRRFIPTLSASVFLLGLVGAVVNVPYVLFSPGPVFNTLGADQGNQLISITGTKTYKTTGELNMTTVSETGGPDEGISLLQGIFALLNNENEVIPREEIYPPGETAEDNYIQSAEDFSLSQSDAIAAAMGYLNKPLRQDVAVTSVKHNVPATNKLKAGDHIRLIDGVMMKTPKQVVSVIRASPIGTVFSFEVLRGAKKEVVKIKSGAYPDDPSTKVDETKIPFIGIGVDMLYSADFTIDFELDDVGGPSAGAMFALGIIDKLTPGSLTGGKIIAGTGTITPTGKVGPIGGIAHKLVGAKRAGAKLFLAPNANCDEVLGHIPAGLTVTPVTNISGAVRAIEGFNKGIEIPECYDKYPSVNKK